jgi:hypothetical protein
MTLVQIVRIPAEGIAAFQEFESEVIPLLAAYGARLERRLRADGGRIEIHIISMPSRDALDRYRADPARMAALPLLEASGAQAELIEMDDLDI